MNISIERNFNDHVDINKISTPQWEGCVYLIDRALFKRSKQLSFINCVGVYIIYGDYFDKKRKEAALYIGESDDVAKRLRHHYKNKEFWNKVLVFSHPRLDIAKTKQIEKKFIQFANSASRYIVTNKTKGTVASNPDIDFIDNFTETSKNILELANLDIFKLNEDAVFTHKECKIRKNGKDYELLKGSIIDTDIYESQPPSPDRAKLLEGLESTHKITVPSVEDSKAVYTESIEINTSILLDKSKLCLLMNNSALTVGLSFKSATGDNLWGLKDSEDYI